MILEPLYWKRLSLAIDVDGGPVWLVDAQEQIDHALPKGVLEVVVVVTTHRGDQLRD